MNVFNNLFQQKEYPEFYQTYLDLSFKSKEVSLNHSRIVVFDTETTGFHFDLDRILCIGAVEIINREINIRNSFEIYLNQERFNENTVPIHGLIRKDGIGEMNEMEAIEEFIKFIGNAILVAHHADFDIAMVNQMLERNGFKKLKNKVLDTRNLYQSTRIKSPLIQKSDNSLDEIAEKYSLDVSDRHTAAGDALITALIFLKTTAILESTKKWSLKKMLKLN